MDSLPALNLSIIEVTLHHDKTETERTIIAGVEDTSEAFQLVVRLNRLRPPRVLFLVRNEAAAEQPKADWDLNHIHTAYMAIARTRGKRRGELMSVLFDRLHDLVINEQGET